MAYDMCVTDPVLLDFFDTIVNSFCVPSLDVLVTAGGRTADLFGVRAVAVATTDELSCNKIPCFANNGADTR